MKIILINDVEKLGAAGEVVEVKKGHARNYLFPRKLAKPYNQENLKVIEKIKHRKEQLVIKEKLSAESLKDRLAVISCTISAEAGEDDKLFGSIAAQDIAEALEGEGFQIDKKKIMLQEPIKKLGVYPVPLKLHPEVIAEIKVWVVKR